LPLSASSRVFITALVLVVGLTPALARSEATVLVPSEHPASSIVIGFVGGFVRHDNPHHGPVQLAQRIQRNGETGAYIQVFENRHRRTAYKTVMHLLDANRDGVLSEEEKSHARIVLFGHSWGAAAAVLLARDLRRNGIPVLLTVQVDSVAKFWQSDAVIPDNVAEAINFYQPHGLIHGRRQIMAANPSKTEILGNYRMDYRQHPVDCLGNSWYERYLTPSHAQSECDPHVWTKIEDLVRQRLTPQTTTATANPHP
jgi:pimeloyl-ACP methyl ester carboxylesterase